MPSSSTATNAASDRALGDLRATVGPTPAGGAVHVLGDDPLPASA